MSDARLRRVLVVTEAGEAWTSGRIRAHLYRGLFERDGIQVDYASRRVPKLTTLAERPVGEGAGRAVALASGVAVAAVNRRLASWRERSIVSRARSRRYDAIYLQKVESLNLVTALRGATRARLVYDLNDGLWLARFAHFAGGRIRDILRSVHAVTCDNPYGLEFARSLVSECYLVPDPAQLELFDAVRGAPRLQRSHTVLGWVGSESTAFNLYSIWEPLERLFAERQDIQLRLVGVGRARWSVPPFEFVRYSTLPSFGPKEMAKEVLDMDVGLFPMFDVEDSRARGILKAAVYMGGGACVVAAPVGQIRDIVRDGENGVLATPSEWLQKVTKLLDAPMERRRMAAQGLETARAMFSLTACYARLREALAGPGSV